MKTETYRGRRLKALRGRGRDSGYTLGWVGGVEKIRHLGDEDGALRSLRGFVDHADEVGVASGRYGAEWYAPGTYELCGHGHAKPLDGLCGHPYCAERRLRPCADIRVGGTCVCDHCMQPYL